MINCYTLNDMDKKCTIIRKNKWFVLLVSRKKKENRIHSNTMFTFFQSPLLNLLL